jgi:multidrug efflux system membrane fusion protein
MTHGKNTMKTFHHLLLILTIIAAMMVAIFLSGGCGKKKHGFQPTMTAPVMAEKAVTMDVPIELLEIGSVEAFTTVAVTARTGGQLLQVLFTEGQEVDKDALLFKIDPGPYGAALAQARANLERDSAMLTKANSDVRRYEGLVQKDFVTKQDYEAVVAAAAETKASVAADLAIVENAALNLGYCSIRAPIAGRTGTVLIKQGNIVAPNSVNPLVVIDQIVPIKVSFAVPEQSLPAVRDAARNAEPPVRVFFSTDSAMIYEGKLTFIDNTVDATTGTVLLKATFPNTDRALWPGQSVRISIELSKQRNAVAVPESAVQSSQQGDYVYVIEPGDSAKVRPVVAGAKYDGRVVIEKGVHAGETVVTDGQFGLKPGAKVTIRSALAPSRSEGEKIK